MPSTFSCQVMCLHLLNKGHECGWVLYCELLMYFLVVNFHIRATSSPLSAFVFVSLVIVYTVRLNVPFDMYIENDVTGFPYMTLQVLQVCGTDNSTTTTSDHAAVCLWKPLCEHLLR